MILLDENDIFNGLSLNGTSSIEVSRYVVCVHSFDSFEDMVQGASLSKLTTNVKSKPD